MIRNKLTGIQQPVFMVGTIQGIQNNIDHLKTIGVTEVILSPIVDSEDYLGQHVNSFENLQETYGSEEELKQLVDQLHEAGIDVLVQTPLQQVSSHRNYWDETGFKQMVRLISLMSLR